MAPPPLTARAARAQKRSIVDPSLSKPSEADDATPNPWAVIMDDTVALIKVSSSVPVRLSNQYQNIHD